jgi:cbb3-type cytochrome oxidase subunit 3
MNGFVRRAVTAVFLMCTLAVGQSAYTPKYKGDPARSNSEAVAIAYMKTALNAQRQYKKKKGKYASTLAGLVGHGSFTKRMVATDRGDYKVGFRGTTDGFALTMTPVLMDAEHRAFYVDQRGSIRFEEDQAATATSPLVNQD